MNVEVISYTPNALKVIYTACRTCYSAVGPLQLKDVSVNKMKELISTVTQSGHHSVLEHVSFTLAIDGVSRALTHQLVRHRLASYSQQSQRYVKYEENDKKPEFIIPEKIKKSIAAKKYYLETMQSIFESYRTLIDMGIPAEDARYLLPNGIETKLIMTMNLRELISASKLRLCFRAQAEIQKLFIEIRKHINKTNPFLASFLKPKCQHQQFCDEKKSCGHYKFDATLATNIKKG